MKSFFSLIIAMIIVVIFVGTALFLWYGSSTTEFSEGPFTEKDTPPKTLKP
jgi:hypothetical protein